MKWVTTSWTYSVNDCKYSGGRVEPTRRSPDIPERNALQVISVILYAQEVLTHFI